MCVLLSGVTPGGLKLPWSIVIISRIILFIVKRQTWVLLLVGVTLVLLGGLAWWRLAWALLALGATVWGALLLAWSTPEKDLPAPPAQPSLTPEELRLEEIIAGNTLLETTMESMREVMLAVDHKQYVVASNRAAMICFARPKKLWRIAVWPN